MVCICPASRNPMARQRCRGTWMSARISRRTGAAVESVSVLFDLFDGDADGYAASGSPGEPLPTGWMVTAAKFEVEWPAEAERAALVRSHFGARRKAFNWGLAQVKADLDAKTVDPGHESVGWDLGSLRKAWNRAKDEVAPWWAANSKECYSCGFGRSGSSD